MKDTTSEPVAVAAIGILGGAIVILMAVGWILLRVTLWALLGSFVGWAFSGSFAVWENKLGMSMGEFGAMLGLVSGAFSVKISKES